MNVGEIDMLEFLLERFTTAEKVEAMLESPIIELIFMALFVIFAVTFVTHLLMYFRIKKIRAYLKETNRMDIEPLQTFKKEFEQRQVNESLKLDTFVQEKFSSWRLFNIPVVSLLKMIQMTVSIFILLGVLGTFIGLTISLGSINSGEDQLVENVAGVLSGIDVAFYTSIIGMGFSLIMTVLVKVLNTEYLLTDLMLTVESHLEGHEQQGLGRMIDVSEKIHQSIESLQTSNQQSLQHLVDSFVGFKDYTAGLEQSAQDLAAFNDGLSSNLEHFQELFQQMKSVTDGFTEGTAALNKNFDALFSYFKKSDRRNERLVESFEHSLGKMQEVSQAQINSFQAFDASADDLKHFTSSLLTEQEEVLQSFSDIRDEHQGLVKTMGTHNEAFKHIFGSDLSTELAGIKKYLNDLTNGFDQVGNSMGALPDALEVIHHTQAEQETWLSDRLDDLKNFNQTFNQHLKRHTTDTNNFEQQMRDVSSTFEQMAEKNNQLIRDINQTVSQMERTFTNRERQLESNVDMMKDTLAQYVANLEGTLGHKLDAVIRNITDSLDQTSSGIQREFSDMRRQSEDMQQNHARATSQLLQDLGREIARLNRQLEILGQQAQTVQGYRRIGAHSDDF